MVDDTVYFLPFDSFGEAYACMLMLNTDLVLDFLTTKVVGRTDETTALSSLISFSTANLHCKSLSRCTEVNDGM